MAINTMEQMLDFTPLLIKRKRRQRKVWFVYFAVVVLTFVLSSLARADDNDMQLRLDVASLHLKEPCAPDIQEFKRRAMIEYEGDLGYWFHKDVGKCMLQRLAILPRLGERLELFEERRTKANDLIHLQKETVRLANEARQEAENALGAAIREKRRAEEDLNHWTRSPWLWTGVGVVLTVGIMIGTSYIMKAVKD